MIRSHCILACCIILIHHQRNHVCSRECHWQWRWKGCQGAKLRIVKRTRMSKMWRSLQRTSDFWLIRARLGRLKCCASQAPRTAAPAPQPCRNPHVPASTSFRSLIRTAPLLCTEYFVNLFCAWLCSLRTVCWKNVHSVLKLHVPPMAAVLKERQFYSIFDYSGLVLRFIFNNALCRIIYGTHSIGGSKWTRPGFQCSWTWQPLNMLSCLLTCEYPVSWYSEAYRRTSSAQMAFASSSPTEFSRIINQIALNT